MWLFPRQSYETPDRPNRLKCVQNIVGEYGVDELMDSFRRP